RQQHLRQRGLHALALAGGEDDHMQWIGHGVAPQIRVTLAENGGNAMARFRERKRRREAGARCEAICTSVLERLAQTFQC
ncbi:MAG TPA: hypothetical protein VGK80_01070, partial [Rhodanobacteraceae bacterium]